MKFPYTIQTELVGQGDYCTITYETELPADAPEGSQIRVENTAHSNDYEAGASVDVGTPGEYNVIKTLVGDVPNGLDPLTWHSQIQYPNTITNADNLTYMDILVDVARYDGSVTLGSHYTTVSTLEQSLSVSCGNTPLNYSQDYTIYVITRQELNDALEAAYGPINYWFYENLYKDTNLWNLLNDTAGLWKRVKDSDPLLAGQYAAGVAGSDEPLGAFLIVFHNSEATGTRYLRVGEGFAPIDIAYRTHVDTDKLGSISGMVRRPTSARSRVTALWPGRAPPSRIPCPNRSAPPDRWRPAMAPLTPAPTPANRFTSTPVRLMTGSTTGFCCLAFRIIRRPLWILCQPG